MENLPFLHSYRDRHGKVRHYVRRRGAKNIAIKGDLGTQAFLLSRYYGASATRLKSGACLPDTAWRLHVDQGIIAGLLAVEYCPIARSSTFALWGNRNDGAGGCRNRARVLGDRRPRVLA